MTIALLRAAALAVALVAPALSAPAVRAEGARAQAAQDNPELRKRADALFRGVGETGGRASWGALESGSGPEGLVIRQIEIVAKDRKKITIGEIEIRAFDWANPREPRHADMAMKRFVVAADQLDAESAANFRELGLAQLTLNGELVFRFDEAEKAFEVSKLFVDVVEMGEFRLRLKLTGITAADLKTALPAEKPKGGKNAAKDGEAVMGLLSRLNVAGAALGFRDKSLVERMVRADARKKNLSEPAAKAKMLEDLAAERGKAADDMTKEFIDAAIKFLTRPGEIELALTPPAPANVMAAFMLVMGNRATFQQMMGVTVSVK
ncbi:MAG: hypothetical protein JNM29_02975 [Candidatus Odyssella sp.]|nr:hypothetical protein [Candidatus Odyssella sp.]